MPKFAVIIRHLPGSRPVTCGVIEESKDSDIDDMASYLNSMADDHIRRFKESFVEFNAATWYVDLIDSDAATPYDTRMILPKA